MKLLTQSIRQALLRNGKLRLQFQEDGIAEPDFLPVVKLFTPDASCTWLLTELDPEDPDTAFGLCDLGLGCPELGSVRISEIESVRGRLGLPVERDRHFSITKTISALADEARAAGYIKL
ncbi:transposase [Rhodobacteraceae bacterium WD3A24]|nr:transposase [Rhodobacteraceae bacterium WD3A24]